MSDKIQYITTPIYYVNDNPHIGHMYTSVASDVYARWQRDNNKNDVYFLTGTDEHGQKVQKSAIKSNKLPQEFCDDISIVFRNLANDANLSHDDFIRTTELRHKVGARAFWQKLHDNGWIYKSEYSGWYALRDEAFYTESELVDGRAPTGAEVEWHVEESYFFKLSEFTVILTELYNIASNLVLPGSKFSEIKNFVTQGLHDLSISRTSFDWGISVPNDERHVIYVWLDALTNYITALGYGSDKCCASGAVIDTSSLTAENNTIIDIVPNVISGGRAEPKDSLSANLLDEERSSSSGSASTSGLRLPHSTPETHNVNVNRDFDLYEHYWQNKNSLKTHVIGKDILRFHAIYWPAFLIAEQFKIGEVDMSEVSKMFQNCRIVTHGWWTNQGQKISKSLGNVINPYDLIAKFGLDKVRFFLLREMPFGNDGDYSESAFIARVNADLSNNFGNLVQRTLGFIWKNCDGKIGNYSGRFDDDKILLPELRNTCNILVSEFKFFEMLNTIMLYSGYCNEFIDKHAPWTLKKTAEIDKMNDVLYALCQAIWQITECLTPFMPQSCATIFGFFNNTKPHSSQQINEPKPVFERIITTCA